MVVRVSASLKKRKGSECEGNGVGVRTMVAAAAVVTVVVTVYVGHVTCLYQAPPLPEVDRSVAINSTMIDTLGVVSYVDKADGVLVNKSQLMGTVQYDYTRESRKLWPHDPQCSWMEVKFGKGLQRTWLLSFPRSGNSWTRYLLEAATGLFTSSVYNSSYLRDLGYLGESDPQWLGTNVAVKTHSLDPLTRHPNLPVIAIIRSPARAILSYWNFNHAEKGWRRYTESVKEASYKTAGFHKFVREKLEKWKSTYVHVLRNTTRLHMVYYERLREAPLREIRAILTFLGIKPAELRMACLARHLEGVTLGAQREVYPYTAWEAANIRRAVNQVDILVRLRGFPPLPDYSRYRN